MGNERVRFFKWSMQEPVFAWLLSPRLSAHERGERETAQNSSGSRFSLSLALSLAISLSCALSRTLLPLSLSLARSHSRAPPTLVLLRVLSALLARPLLSMLCDKSQPFLIPASMSTSPFTLTLHTILTPLCPPCPHRTFLQCKLCRTLCPPSLALRQAPPSQPGLGDRS
jgi:hypothetical protein